MAVSYLARKIKAIAHFDIKDLNPIQAAVMCFSPVLIMHGAQDTVIKPEHSQKLFAACAGEDTELRIIEGADHNRKSPFDIRVQAILFVARALKAPVVIDAISGLVASARYHFAGVHEIMEVAQMRQFAADHAPDESEANSDSLNLREFGLQIETLFLYGNQSRMQFGETRFSSKETSSSLS
jgi:pimeloyl-ACP methyl ester carboxylesterase